MRRVPPATIFKSDICIVGSGPAGLAIATELANTDREVLVVESGDQDRENAFAASLNEIESVGEPREMDQGKLRNRVLGGSSHTWSGRCTSFDTIDYQARDWVPNTGWPIGAEDIAPFLDRSAEYLGLPAIDNEDALLSPTSLPPALAGGAQAELRSVFWRFSRGSFHNDFVRFGPRFLRLTAPNIRVLTNATVTSIATSGSGNHVARLTVAAPSGVVHHVRSQYFILCGGGIENPRLMLASNELDPRGVGNANGLVGRFLMDHPRAILGTFAPAAIPAVQEKFGLLDSTSGARIQRGLSLQPELQCKQKLLNCAAWTTQHVADDDVWRAMRVLGRDPSRARLALAKVALRHADQIVAGIWHKFVRGAALPRRMTRLDMEVMIEQAPDRDSRITLAERRDPLGVPLSRIDWKIGEMERQTAVRLGHAFNDGLERAGLPTATLVDWVRDRRPEDAVFTDPAHPMGATRMATGPENGVVDRDCKVFGIDNLYVAGSSVFPTSGHANPTLTIVALAIRLADMLRLKVMAGTLEEVTASVDRKA